MDSGTKVVFFDVYLRVSKNLFATYINVFSQHFADGLEKMVVFSPHNSSFRWKLKVVHPQHWLLLGCHTVIYFINIFVHYFTI
jgi:hypothetical protein